MLYHTVPCRNRIVQVENILHELDIGIDSDRKHSFDIHIQLDQVVHFQFLLLGRIFSIILVYYLSEFRFIKMTISSSLKHLQVSIVQS